MTYPVATYNATLTGIRNKEAYWFIPVSAITTVPAPSKMQDDTMALQTIPHQRKDRWPAVPKRVYATYMVYRIS